MNKTEDEIEEIIAKKRASTNRFIGSYKDVTVYASDGTIISQPSDFSDDGSLEVEE